MSKELKHKIKKLPFLQKYFYDFYLATHLWWTYGSGKSIYGFESTYILSYDKEQKLNDFCLETFEKTKQKVLTELYYCIVREGRHMSLGQGDNYSEIQNKYFLNKNSRKYRNINIKPKWKLCKTKTNFYLKIEKMNLTQRQYLELLIFLIPEYSENVIKFLNGSLIPIEESECLLNEFNTINDYINNNLETSLNNFFEDFSENIFRYNAHAYLGAQDSICFDRPEPINICDQTVFILEKIFSLYRLWNPYYGGRKWAKACKMWFELYHSKTIKNDIFIIDKIFDLQHNTGIIFSKRGCHFRQLSKGHLDNRSKFCHNKDFVPFISSKGSKHCLNYFSL
jgi:hypothetical protein